MLSENVFLGEKYRVLRGKVPLEEFSGKELKSCGESPKRKTSPREEY
jgi:hypothetical protein